MHETSIYIKSFKIYCEHYTPFKSVTTSNGELSLHIDVKPALLIVIIVEPFMYIN